MHIYHQLDPDWRAELARVVTDPTQLLTMLDLNPDEFREAIAARRLFPMRVPVPFVRLMTKGNPKDPLLLQVMPAKEEFLQHADYVQDPLAEHEPKVPGLLHKYKTRALLLLRTACAINCRYCFRRHFPYADNQLSYEQRAQALEAIAGDSALNEVILSGGDPLMAQDKHIFAIMAALEQMPHIKRLRIHTRLPVVIPSRLTQALAERCAQSSLQVVMVLHVNHAQEISPALQQGLVQYRQAGVTLLNQAVLLAGVNTELATQVQLCEALFAAGVLPYYLHVLDKVEGAMHFDSSEAEALVLIQAMRSALPGFLVPRLVREIAGETSKTVLA